MKRKLKRKRRNNLAAVNVTKVEKSLLVIVITVAAVRSSHDERHLSHYFSNHLKSHMAAASGASSESIDHSLDLSSVS